MKSNHRQTKLVGMLIRQLVAIVCMTLLVFPTGLLVVGQSQSPPASGDQQKAPPIPPDQLDALVAPIALYPDPMLSQTLVASTYPLELIQLQQWLTRHPNLKDKALADAVAKQPWDPSIQAMAGLPDLVKRLADDIQWTTDLGNAFLAQQSDVMDAVQRMRRKAQDKGALKSNEHQKVEVQTVESKQVIVIEQPNPQVVYVPSYDPVVVYGPPVYPYPPIYYPPYYAGAALIGFGVGFAMGAFWGGGWGWGCGWGGNDININNNFNFNRNANINGGNRNRVNPLGGNNGRGGNNTWRHNPEHRGGAPYRDRATADRFGGTARGDSLAKRQGGARQQIGRQGNNFGSGSRNGLNGNRPSTGAGNRPSAGGGNRPSTRPSGGGGDRVGNRSIPKTTGGNKGGFGTGGFNKGSTRSSSSRGSSSMGGMRGGGGGSRGGGGRGGGGRRGR